MLRELKIGLTPDHLRREALSSSELDTAERELRKAKPTVFTRDDHTCAFCGYKEEIETLRTISASSGEPKAKSHLDIVFLDRDIRNTSLDNLAMACIFCSPIHSINTINPMQKWHVAWAPLLEQLWVSCAARALMMIDHLLFQFDSGTDRQAGISGYASGITANLSMLRDEMHGAHLMAREKLGIRDFASFVEALSQLALVGEGHYARRSEFLKGFVLIPNGLISEDWAGFDHTFQAISTGGTLASLNNVYDLVETGRYGFSIAEASYRH